MSMRIRKAGIDDCPEMMELIRELAAFEKEPDAVTVSLPEFEDAGFGRTPVWRAFVAETYFEPTNESKIVGMALYYYRYSTWKGKMLYLEDIVIRQSHRGQGIGSLLFRELIRVAEAEGLYGMAWQVLDWNETAISFYNKTKGVTFDSSWLNAGLALRQHPNF